MGEWETPDELFKLDFIMTHVLHSPSALDGSLRYMYLEQARGVLGGAEGGGGRGRGFSSLPKGTQPQPQPQPLSTVPVSHRLERPSRGAASPGWGSTTSRTS